MDPDLLVRADSVVVAAHRGDVQVIDELAGEWAELCSRAADDQIFYRPEFIRAHIRAMVPDARVLIITVRKDRILLLLLPLVQERSTFSKIPVRRLRGPVDLNCGRFDAVRASHADGDAAVIATWRYLKEMADWDVLQLSYSLPGSTTGRLAELAQAEDFPVMRMPDCPNPYLPLRPEALGRSPRSSRLRTKLRQVKRRTAEEGALKFYRLERADRDALDRLFALEASGWKGRAGTAVNCHPRIRQFFDELAESAAKLGCLSLYMLEFKDKLIAAHYSLIYRGRCHSPVVAFNEEYRDLAPGHLIVAEILRDCVTRGDFAYDITGQDQEWKMKWTSESLPVSHHYIFKGPIGRLAHGLGVRLRSSLRLLSPRRKQVGSPLAA